MATVFKRGGRKGQGGYYFAYYDHRQRRIVRSARTTDHDAARRIAAKYESDAALRRDGVVDPRLDELGQQGKRSIEDHLADYEAKLQAAGRSADYVTRTRVFILDT
jgi:anti-sigma factor RsiW